MHTPALTPFPPHLLLEIVYSSDAQELVASQLLSTVCLVCKRWRRAVYSEPALWRAFSLRADLLWGAPYARQAQWLNATFNLLRRVAQHIEAFSAYDCHQLERWQAAVAGCWGLAQFLYLLRPSRLQALTLHNYNQHMFAVSDRDRALPEAAVEAIASFTRLTALHLGSPGRPLPPCTQGVLRQLSRLQRLRLHSSEVAQARPLISSIGQLTALTWLDVCTLVFAAAAAAELTQLTCLRHLRLLGGQLEPPGLAAFPLLESFELEHVAVSRELTECRVCTAGSRMRWGPECLAPRAPSSVRLCLTTRLLHTRPEANRLPLPPIALAGWGNFSAAPRAQPERHVVAGWLWHPAAAAIVPPAAASGRAGCPPASGLQRARPPDSSGPQLL